MFVCIYVVIYFRAWYDGCDHENVRIFPGSAPGKGAEDYWVRRAHSSLHQGIQKGELASLTPFINGSGIIKVGARTDPTLMSYDNQHATLLPYGQWISTLITRDAHQYGRTDIATTTAQLKRNIGLSRETLYPKEQSSNAPFFESLKPKYQLSSWPICHFIGNSHLRHRFCTLHVTILGLSQ